MTKLTYTGEQLSTIITIERKNKVAEKIYPYIPDEDLVRAVNLAILLQRPLLLMGEPGCGKTRLAQAVAYELYHKSDGETISQDYQDLYFEWNIKSTSKAKEGLYEFDAIARLGDAQILKNLTKEELKKELDKSKYISDRPMGLAIDKSTSEDKRAILLIDEIDKADIDFPNDLLNELDKGEYTITETNKTIQGKEKPIIFITSNGEKELPDAFLRRCVFHYIEPLEGDKLGKIIERRYYKETIPNEKLIQKAVQQFIEIRDELHKKRLRVGKNVSTSELLDWFEALKYYSELDKGENSKMKHQKDLINELEKLGQGIKDIPFQQVLFKNLNSLINFKREHES